MVQTVYNHSRIMFVIKAFRYRTPQGFLNISSGAAHMRHVECHVQALEQLHIANVEIKQLSEQTLGDTGRVGFRNQIRLCLDVSSASPTEVRALLTDLVEDYVGCFGSLESLKALNDPVGESRLSDAGFARNEEISVLATNE